MELYSAVSCGRKVRLVVFTVLATLNAVSAVDYWVDQSTGVDNPACGGEASPCATIAYASNRTSGEPGDAVLRVLQGTYAGERIVNPGGWNRLVAEAGPALTFFDHGRDATTQLALEFGAVNMSHVAIEGFQFIRNSGYSIRFYGVNGLVRNCIFDGSDGDPSNVGGVRSELDFGGGPTPEQSPGGQGEIHVDATIFRNFAVTAQSLLTYAVLSCLVCTNVTLTNSRLQDVTTLGAAVEMAFGSGAGSTTIENVEFSGVVGCTGHAVTVKYSLSLAMRHVSIAGGGLPASCSSAGAGAIRMQFGSRLAMADVNVTGDAGVQGSAVSFEHADTLEMTDCVFEGNAASDAGTLFIDAAQDNLVALSLERVAFLNNTASVGSGGIDFRARTGPATLSLVDCDFIGNLARATQSRGGALVITWTNVTVSVAGGTFRGNEGRFGGAIALDIDNGNNSSMTVTDVAFVDNVAAYGGAVHYLANSPLSFTRCKFEGNRALFAGGSIELDDVVPSESVVTVDACTFYDDQAGDIGGAIAVGNGILRINSSDISGCVAAQGGALYVAEGMIEAGDLVLENNVAVESTACIGSTGYGAGIYFDAESCLSNNTLSNVVFRNNSAEVSGGAIYHVAEECDLSALCSPCTYDNNTAVYGDRFGAPFSHLRLDTADLEAPEPGVDVHVSLHELVDILATAIDSYGQEMLGQHPVIRTRLAVASEEHREAFVVSGDVQHNVDTGVVSYPVRFHIDGKMESAIQTQVNAGNDVKVDMQIIPDPSIVDAAPMNFTLEVAGCRKGYQLDLTPSAELETLGLAADAAFLECAEQLALSDPLRKLCIAALVISGLVLVALSIGMAVFRRSRAIWNASVQLMAGVMLGCFLMWTSALVRTLPATEGTCNYIEWQFVAGLDIAVGCTLTKNLRIRRIFASKKLVIKSMTNLQLSMIVVVLLVPDLVILTIWRLVDPLRVNPESLQAACDSDLRMKFLAALAAAKSVAVVLGLLLAFRLRDIPYHFSEAKAVAWQSALVFVFVSVVWGTGPTMAVQARLVTEVLSGLVLCTAIACLMLLPKFWQIFKGRDKSGLTSSTDKETRTGNTFTFVDDRGAPHTVSSSEDGEGGKRKKRKNRPRINFHARYQHLNDELRRCEVLYEQSLESTQALAKRHRELENKKVALGFEEDFQAAREESFNDDVEKPPKKCQEKPEKLPSVEETPDVSRSGGGAAGVDLEEEEEEEEENERDHFENATAGTAGGARKRSSTSTGSVELQEGTPTTT